MQNIEVIFDGKIYGLFSQVALFCAEAKNAYPQWKTGDEHVVFGQRGVVVATATDQPIEVIVYTGKEKPEHVLCVSGEILIGDQGFIVGNVASENMIGGSWQNGVYAIVVYTNGIGNTVTKIYFYIEYLGRARL